ncbi:MAG: hypothetical protein IJ499_05635 [Clostridia bacterium]|nr:hypothetical protein [Clostridia bacterium]
MRSEEEIRGDLLMHEKRSAAQEKVNRAKVLRRKALVAAAIGVVALFAVMGVFIFSAYDSQNVLLLAVLLAVYVLGVIAVFYIYGWIKCGSLKYFWRSMRYIVKLEEALEDMDKIEEKYAERTIRLSDMDEFEKKFLSLCDKINEEL